MKNYVCEITEVLRRQIVVRASSADDAEVTVEAMCDNDVILLNCEDFH